jgi:hypothetical protein
MRSLIRFQRQAICQEEEDAEDAFMAIIALALLGKPNHILSLRMYLTHPDLLGNPRTNSPWNHMRLVWNDHAFITVMGIDVATFEAILKHFD